ncbi:type II toxin-antitoxin system PemK/MazF family toxin [Synechococcus sp. 1G10]|uniref:type II toxin-antitoxin system PemK/MazF family toxin n=1 Tax=Synechococcus sp. 1G10 TaxID=2025605 RepID=UPI0018E92AD5|nr:type II toxin-antitoxin system PemK/MazF family toxin [Synechococcus sp. 1G10]
MTKAQGTIPQPVRAALHLQASDPFGSFSEWHSVADVKPMASFEQGDVIKVPFPYIDRPTRKFCPALDVSSNATDEANVFLWVVMFTSADNRGWPADVLVSNLPPAGLPVPSQIRTAKIPTIEASEATKLGNVPRALFLQVTRRI